MRFLSMFSGIEAASVAWRPLGWEAVAFCEIDPFASAVLKHHYPNVPNLGDVTEADIDAIGNVDLAVGGSPCQSFSIAGKRLGLDDARGNLALVYGQVVYRKRPRWFVFENVPGLLSSDSGWDFGTLLAAFAGYPPGSVFEPPVGGWKNAGITRQAVGGYGLAWRVLDAQYVRVDGFGRAVPQRRRRVFVVGCLGDWRRAAAVLFERASLRGDPAPRREAGQGIAGTVTARVGSGVGADENHARDGHLVANTMSSKWAKGRGGYAGQNETDNCCIVPAQDPANCLGAAPAAHTSHGEGQTNYAIVAGCASTLNANYGSKWGLDDQHINQGAPLFVAQGVAHALRADGFDASEDGTGRGTPLVPVPQGVALRGRDDGATAELTGDIMTALRTGGGGGDKPYVMLPFDETQITHRANRSNPQPGDPCHPLAKSARPPTLASSTITGWRVRRLMPVEAERLMGFPDGYTAIPYRSKPAADGPRYKALGNSFAVNVMRWIGRRIEQVERIR